MSSHQWLLWQHLPCYFTKPMYLSHICSSTNSDSHPPFSSSSALLWSSLLWPWLWAGTLLLQLNLFWHGFFPGISAAPANHHSTHLLWGWSGTELAATQLPDALRSQNGIVSPRVFCWSHTACQIDEEGAFFPYLAAFCYLALALLCPKFLIIFLGKLLIKIEL